MNISVNIYIMRKFYQLLKFSIFIIFVIFVIIFSPRQTLAFSLNDIFSSPDSLIVRIQERIEYFFAFSTEQKVIILEKQAERRLTQAEKLAKINGVDQTLSLIKSYETLKKTQGDLIKAASITVPAEVKEQTVQQQARIENMKEDLPESTKEIVENSQKTVIKTVIDNLQDENSGTIENEATEFAEEVKNVLDPGSNIFAPGTNEVIPGTLEVAPGGSEIAPGSLEVAPGGTNVKP